MRRITFVTLLSLTGLSQMVAADLVLPKIFGDHMVLQRERPIPVWGTGKPGEKLTVELAGSIVSTTVPSGGNWFVQLSPKPAGGPYTMMVKGTSEVRFEDVFIGEVWLAAGQSNMEWILKETDGASEEIASSSNPRLRILKVERKVAESPASDFDGVWRVSEPSKAGWFSAVGYYFAKYLIEDLNVAVGVINCSRGSSQILPWIPREVIDRDPIFAPDLEKWSRAQQTFPEAKLDYDKKLAEWEATAPDQRTGSAPQPPYGPGHYNTPGGLFNGMVAPARHFPIRGILWYQGEANAKSAGQYAKAFPLLIQSWRKAWNDPSLPFLFVQVAPYAAGDFKPDGLERAELREAQAAALSLPYTGMVVTLDIGGPAEHPRNKRDVGLRLAKVALRLVYGKNVISEGPALEKAEFGLRQVRVSFKNAASGLRTADGDAAVKGFEVAGADGNYKSVPARIEGTTVVLDCSTINSAASLRYAWANFPSVNLVGGTGLPAVPFRTQKNKP